MNIVVFDVGGTLLPTPTKSVVKKIAHEFEIPLEISGIRNMKINTLANEVKALGINPERFFDRYWEIYAEEVKKASLFPETRTVLQGLKKEGKRLAIFSDIRLNVIHTIFRDHNLMHFFEDIACLDDVKPKPNPDGLIHLANCMSVSTEDMLFVGDRIADKRAGDRAGVEVFLIDHSSDLLKLLDN